MCVLTFCIEEKINVSIHCNSKRVKMPHFENHAGALNRFFFTISLPCTLGLCFIFQSLYVCIFRYLHNVQTLMFYLHILSAVFKIEGWSLTSKNVEKH